MVRLLNRHSFLLIFLIMVSFMSSSIWGCDSGGGGGGGNKTRINGTVLEVIGGSVSDIKVTIFENNNKRASDKTDQFGDFNLKFEPNSNMVEIEFKGSNFTLSMFISVTRDSDVEFDVTLVTSPGQIIVENWTVDQNPLRVNNEEIIFTSLEADFNIDGDGGDCIRALGDGRLEVTARNISISDCKEGISAENSGIVIFEAAEDIRISANKNGIKANNNAIVTISQTDVPNNNNIFIDSSKENGIKSSDSSEVIVDPQNDCTISGGDNKSAINPTGASTIDPDGCTLVDG
ncbi:MAG: hypothetical protein ACREN0_01995 [Thermodesulfobacteriota bacterium]